MSFVEVSGIAGFCTITIVCLFNSKKRIGRNCQITNSEELLNLKQESKLLLRKYFVLTYILIPVALSLVMALFDRLNINAEFISGLMIYTLMLGVCLTGVNWTKFECSQQELAERGRSGEHERKQDRKFFASLLITALVIFILSAFTLLLLFTIAGPDPNIIKDVFHNERIIR